MAVQPTLRTQCRLVPLGGTQRHRQAKIPSLRQPAYRTQSRAVPPCRIQAQAQCSHQQFIQPSIQVLCPYLDRASCLFPVPRPCRFRYQQEFQCLVRLLGRRTFRRGPHLSPHFCRQSSRFPYQRLNRPYIRLCCRPQCHYRRLLFNQPLHPRGSRPFGPLAHQHPFPQSRLHRCHLVDPLPSQPTLPRALQHLNLLPRESTGFPNPIRALT